MEYRDIYKALEHRWKTTAGFRFLDFSGWRQPQSVLGHRSRLIVVIEDQTTMRRICISHKDGPMIITYAPINGDGQHHSQPVSISCKNEADAARALEQLFVQLDQAA